ncbi:unnamed protein product [Paramecium sonneborni]|uniref:Protein kinase domain-containing protein n=1 Tax=Paramecium sonneborni TaxID=65129 RepID=A0A8S1QUJ8_9CILI|nr:unnamed protein product [Paramecium sonneborni]
MDKQNMYLNRFFIDKKNKSNTFWEKDFRKLISNESNFTLNNDNCICLYKKGKYFNKFIARYYTIQGTYLFYGDKDLKGFRKLENVYMSTSLGMNVYPYQIELMHNHNQIVLQTNSELDFLQFKQQLEHFCILVGFQNEYIIINQIGFGSTAQVFISKFLRDGFYYAIKRIRKNSKLNPQFLMEEIQVLNDLSHPNIIKLHRIFETNQHINMVLQLVEGGELLKSQRYNIRDARIIFKQLVECVDYMHQKGVMHRDLKPQNILCKTNSLDIVLADFGLATYIKAKSHIYYRCGTTGYVAPEILQYKEGNKMYTEKCDIFSLGVILYQLIYNQHPFKDSQKEKMLKNNLYVEYKFDDAIKIPQCCKELISLMLKQNPKQRPNADEILKHEFFYEQFFEHQNQTLTYLEPYSDQKRSGPSLSSYNVDIKFSTLNNGFKLFEDEVDYNQHQDGDLIETSPLWSKRIELQRCQSQRSQASSIVIQRQQSQDFKTKKLSIFRAELKQQSLQVLLPQMDKSTQESSDYHQIPYIFQTNMLLVHKKKYY